MKKSFAMFGMGFVLMIIAATQWGCAGNGRTASAGWTTFIQNGSGLENFVRIGDANWREQDGTVMADKGGKEPSYLVTRQAYGDFVIYAEFLVSDDANSGIFIRLSDERVITATNSYEVNIFDKRPDPSYGTGAIVGFAKVSPMPKAGGWWSTFEITAKGPLLTVKMNGVTTAEVRDRSFTHGPFALQYGTGIVKFRNVQIKPL
jgi:hypothetical protein